MFRGVGANLLKNSDGGGSKKCRGAELRVVAAVRIDALRSAAQKGFAPAVFQ